MVACKADRERGEKTSVCSASNAVPVRTRRDRLVVRFPRAAVPDHSTKEITDSKRSKIPG